MRVSSCIGRPRREMRTALVDPDFLPELAADVCEALLAVEAEGFQTAVAEHFYDLRVLWKWEFKSLVGLS